VVGGRARHGVHVVKRPAPATVRTGLQTAFPFVGCFGRYECELMAAIYVEICQAAGYWRSVSWPDVKWFLAWHAFAPVPPRWVEALMSLGIYPDMPGLVKGGWFTMDEQELVQPTDAFFRAIERHVVTS
jgi:hypothetical protein